VVNIEPKYPASQNAEDRAATARAEAYMNRQYLEPACLGRYPDLMKEIFGDAWPSWADEDLELIRQPMDYVGVNYYSRSVVRADPNNWLLRASPLKQASAPHTDIGWEVFPQGLTDTLKWIHDSYGAPPIYVTENGAAFADPPTVAVEPLEDPLRVDYFRAHLRAVRDAIGQGVDVRGYFAWSLLDNFEWAYGFSKRFGIVHVDYATQQRTRKASADFYSRVIATNGKVLDAARPVSR
jgi:beta-glucosidase